MVGEVVVPATTPANTTKPANKNGSN